MQNRVLSVKTTKSSNERAQGRTFGWLANQRWRRSLTFLSSLLRARGGLAFRTNSMRLWRFRLKRTLTLYYAAMQSVQVADYHLRSCHPLKLGCSVLAHVQWDYRRASWLLAADVPWPQAGRSLVISPRARARASCSYPTSNPHAATLHFSISLYISLDLRSFLPKFARANYRTRHFCLTSNAQSLTRDALAPQGMPLVSPLFAYIIIHDTYLSGLILC